jgi:hypothetical protein
METNIEAPRPEAPPYNWPSHDLKNLVLLAPMSPYTRALLRIKFNCPVPDGATTFEQIEAWLATLKPIPKPPTSASIWDAGWTPPHDTTAAEIRRGEYIEVDAQETGHNHYTRSWTKRSEVQVPLSVWEAGKDAVEEYVQDEISTLEEDEDDRRFEFSESGDDTDFEIIDDLDALMERAEQMIAERDGDDEDEDEDEDEDDE